MAAADKLLPCLEQLPPKEAGLKISNKEAQCLGEWRRPILQDGAARAPKEQDMDKRDTYGIEQNAQPRESFDGFILLADVRCGAALQCVVGAKKLAAIAEPFTREDTKGGRAHLNKSCGFVARTRVGEEQGLGSGSPLDQLTIGNTKKLSMSSHGSASRSPANLPLAPPPDQERRTKPSTMPAAIPMGTSIVVASCCW